jgi:hypothetical protein
MTWQISDGLFVAMVLFDCMGIAFVGFIAMFIINYTAFGLTSKVDEEKPAKKTARTGSRSSFSVLKEGVVAQKRKKISCENPEGGDASERVRPTQHPPGPTRLMSVESTNSQVSGA